MSPIIGSLPGCCARAASGHALAVTAKRLMKSPRLSGPRGVCFPQTLPIGIANTVPPKPVFNSITSLACDDHANGSTTFEVIDEKLVITAQG
jgi:hypothetical protein